MFADFARSIDLRADYWGPLTLAVATAWRAPADLPATGTIVKTSIPADDTAFTPRDSYIYLPPAYSAPNRSLLPVLVLMAGNQEAPETGSTSAVPTIFSIPTQQTTAGWHPLLWWLTSSAATGITRCAAIPPTAR